MSESEPADVVIVGYGPTGQLLALMLGRQGHKVVVVDRWPDLYPLPRAVHFDDEIGRILQAAGAMDAVEAIIEPSDLYQWRNAAGDVLIEFDWGGRGPSGWPISNIFSQPQLERVLDAKVKAQPTVAVRQGWSASSLSQDASGVHVGIEHGDFRDGQWVPDGGKDALHARFVVGADGANSFVRRALGVSMHDLGFSFDWLVVDVIPHTKRDWYPKAWQLCDPRRPTTIIPGGPGRRRWEFMALPGEYAEDLNRAEVAWRLLAPWDITPENATLERHAVYKFRGQWATSWKEGRVLLAGDAAHLTPPFAGQGMCSGIRDSAALAWRLDLALRDIAPDDVFDSYGPERSAHVQEWIDFAVELGKVICVPDPEAAAQRDREMLDVRAQTNFRPPPTPSPRLGAGLYLDEAPGSGRLGPQGLVEMNGRRGLFDDLVGVRFAVIAKSPAILGEISEANRKALDRLGAAVIHFDENAGGLKDAEGTYHRFLDNLGCEAMLARPDFYLQGAARNAAELNRLLDVTRARLMINVPDCESSAYLVKHAEPSLSPGLERRQNPDARALQ